jgi:DNA-binding MarR family transcriptional regulator
MPMSGSEVSNEDLVALWQNVSLGVTAVEQRIDQRLNDAGVPAQWFAVLRLLHGADDHQLPMSALAREVSMTSGGFTKLADRMAREGLIDRRGSAHDRRVVNATLTGDGLRVATHALGVYLDALRDCVLGIVSADGLASVAATLGRLRASRDASGEETPDFLASERSPELPDRRRREAAGGEGRDRADTSVSGPLMPSG